MKNIDELCEGCGIQGQQTQEECSLSSRHRLSPLWCLCGSPKKKESTPGTEKQWWYVHLESMCLDTRQRAQIPGFRSCSNHLLVMWPWASYFTAQFYPLYCGCDKVALTSHILLVLHASLLSLSLGPSSSHTWMASTLISVGTLWKFQLLREALLDFTEILAFFSSYYF